MSSRPVLVLLLGLLLSGCADPEVPAAAVPLAVDASTEERTFERRFELTLREVRDAAGGHTARGVNCVMFPSDGLRFVNGSAKASWTPAATGAQRLTLLIDEGWEREISEAKNKASPLEVSFANVTSETDWGSFDFAVFLDEPGLVVQQPVSITLSFTYMGPADLETRIGSCGRA